MEIKPNGSRPSLKARGRIFHRHRTPGTIDAGAGAGSRPGRQCQLRPRRPHGTRHTHPFGQTLVVTSGKGLAQSWGGEIRKSTPATFSGLRRAKKHWHGAGPDTALTHIAIQEMQDGKAADWME